MHTQDIASRAQDIASRAGHPSWIERARPWLPSGIIQRRVFETLDAMQGGAVRIVDANGEHTLGQGAVKARVQVHDPSFYTAMALNGSLGVGESYVEGKWDCDDLYALFRLFAEQREMVQAVDGGTASLARPFLRFLERARRNTRTGSKANIAAHYDLGNDLFELFLDPTMTYSCGVFESEDTTLEQASIAKLDRMCRKLDLRPTDRVVEIGSGWGSFALHASKQYGCHITTITISEEQFAEAKRRIQAAGLEKRIDLRLCDYRELEGTYDKLVSIEMIEAVGPQYYRDYFGAIERLLAPHGAAAIQAIVVADHAYEEHRNGVDFIQKYVFPGSSIPSISVLLQEASRSSTLRLVDLDDITRHYGPTLLAWRERFQQNLDAVRKLGYPDEFLRLWDYYLCYCAAGFDERYLGTVQMTLGKQGFEPRIA